MVPGGQRMVTALAYLNDVEDGGATDFPDIGVSVKPNKGDVVFSTIAKKAVLILILIHFMADRLLSLVRNGP